VVSGTRPGASPNPHPRLPPQIYTTHSRPLHQHNLHWAVRASIRPVRQHRSPCNCPDRACRRSSASLLRVRTPQPHSAQHLSPPPVVYDDRALFIKSRTLDPGMCLPLIPNVLRRVAGFDTSSSTVSPPSLENDPRWAMVYSVPCARINSLTRAGAALTRIPHRTITASRSSESASACTISGRSCPAPNTDVRHACPPREEHSPRTVCVPRQSACSRGAPLSVEHHHIVMQALERNRNPIITS
jgi:hypothetical protein